MKLFIDSTQERFVAAIIDKNNKTSFSSNVETKYKVEEIINFFDLIDVNLITQIYINLGPGTFTGSRISLLYVRTLAQLNSNIQIYVSNTFDILSKQNKKIFFANRFYIKATKNKSYYFNGKEIDVVDKSKKEKLINYKDILDNFNEYIDIFKLINLEELLPYYVISPQIGVIKK